MAYEIKINKTQNSRILELDQNNIGFGKIFTDHMFVCDFDGENWVSPTIEPYGPMMLSPATSALHYGQAIFEGMKAFHYHKDVALFRPKDNARRLNVSARRMVMPEIPLDLFMQGLETLIDLDRAWVPTSEGSSLYIRPFMFATDDHVGVRPSQKYRFVIFCCPVGPYYSQPLKVKVEEEFSRAAPGGTGFAKCAGNYGGSLFPTKKAQDEGYDQVLWTDPITHKLVEETGTTNIFAVIGDRVVTPMPGNTMLSGITRDSVIEVLKSENIIVEERALSVAELKETLKAGELKELFITGTAATLINLSGFGHQNQFYDVMAKGDTHISERVKTTLDALKRGQIEDTFGWMTVLKAQETLN